MALLGHVSTQMSLRYAHLFDSTVRTEYERALDLAKSLIGPHAAGRPQLLITEITGSDWKQGRPSNHAWPADTAYGRPPRGPACTPTSVNTVPASSPTQPISESSPHNA